MTPASRSSRRRRRRRLLPALVALEDRALLSAARPESIKVSKHVHIDAHKAPAPPPPSITPLNQAGGFKFLNFDGPAQGASPPIVTNMNGLSNAGAAVGFTIDVNGGFHNFTVTPTKSPKATLLNINGSTAAMALGVNKHGIVVGTDGKGNAFTLRGKTLTTFIPTGGSSAIAFGINDLAVIVGQDVVGGTTPGFIRAKANSDITINAPSGPDTVNAQGINNNGLVVGFYVGTDGQDHGFVANRKAAKNGTLTATAVADPMIPPVAGEPGSTFVFSQILGVNDKGIAVGYYGDSTTSQHGFLYNTKTGQYKFLDDPAAAFHNGVEVTQITGISNSGEIAGFYTDANGVAHGFVAAT